MHKFISGTIVNPEGYKTSLDHSFLRRFSLKSDSLIGDDITKEQNPSVEASCNTYPSNGYLRSRSYISFIYLLSATLCNKKLE